jgi:hypothetical protein
MTIKEFLEFISQDGGHFIGFLLVLGMIGGGIEILFRGIMSVIRAIKERPKAKKAEKTA